MSKFVPTRGKWWRQIAVGMAAVLGVIAVCGTPAMPQSRPPQLERITLTPSGFEPVRVRRPPGRFVLAVDNRSRLDLAVLRLDGEGNVRVREMQMRRGKLKWRETLTLPPGRYALRETTHANWVCEITVAAQ